MAIQIGAKPDSGFDDPIGMLKDCHRRIESFLGILCVVVDRAEGRSLTSEERDAVKAALRYFRTGGQRHTADEEESLFPRLRACDANSLEEINRLEGDHREANDLQASVERLYSTWMACAELPSRDARQLKSQTERLKQLIAKRSQDLGMSAEEFESKLGGEAPLKRVGQPEEVADAIVWLASDRASYITGQTLLVDGGLFKGL